MMSWIIDNRPDKNIEPELLEHIASELEAKNPQTVIEYAKILRLERHVVENWFKHPMPKNHSKYWWRRRLAFGYKYPELSAKMTA